VLLNSRQTQTLQKERLLFDSQLADALSQFAQKVKAGSSVQQSLDQITQFAPSPIRESFKGLLSDLKRGLSFESALGSLKNRHSSEALGLMCSALILQRQTGGNLAEILNSLSESVREQERLTRQIESLTAQSRLSGLVLALLPLFMLLMMLAISPERMIFFLNHPLGIVICLVSLGWMGLGFGVMNKILAGLNPHA
jgi:tight adherence protein B